MDRCVKILINIGVIFGIALSMYIIAFIVFPTIYIFLESGRILNWLNDSHEKNNEFYFFITLIFTVAFSSLLTWLVLREKTRNKYTKTKIGKKYGEFMQDADDLYIFAGDLDFLLSNEKQLKIIENLGSRCRILFSGDKKNEMSEKLRNLYNELLKKDVNIRKYSKNYDNDIKSLRGQVKINNNGQTWLFVNREENFTKKIKFEIFNIKHKYIIDKLLNWFNDSHASAKHPLIKYILFDMGGVYFDGDFDEDFLSKINKLLSVNIETKREYKLLLSKDLNLGNITIIDWVQSQIARALTLEEKDKIEDIWKNIWKPNKKMQQLVISLKNNGYQVGIMSNMDRMNGEKYISEGYFEEFDPKDRFLSYVEKHVKPNREFFELVLTRLNVKSYEILFIDDHEDNVNIARELGMLPIPFDLKTDQNLEKLKGNLKKHQIDITGLE